MLEKMDQKYLFEVVPIRLFLVVMLVFYHAFAIFSGAWKPIEGYPEIPLYSLLDQLSYACLLETFVFISGYVYGYQIKKHGGYTFSWQEVVAKKLKRLIVPSILFSSIYLFIFNNYKQPIYLSVYQILSGIGHMWFLPMLFWCFVLLHLFERSRISIYQVCCLSFVMMFASVLPFPLGLASTMYYYIFFYIGYLIQKNGYRVKVDVIKRMPVFVAAFMCLFVLKIHINDIMLSIGSILYGGG